VNEETHPIAQAIYVLANDEIRERGRSADFDLSWLPEVERLCRGFGVPTPGLAFPLAVFAQPFGPRHAAVVQVAPAPAGGLAFRILVIPRRVYTRLIADPFRVAEKFPPNWNQTGPLPTLEWPNEPPPRRTVAELQHVLQTGGSPTLLGAAQGLVDGGRVVFERAAPATQLVRDIWQLLPMSAQIELWPTTFAFSNDLRFDILVVPKVEGLKLDRYLTEEHALDYPEQRYEFNLQYAIEHGDQREIDALLTRRSSKQMLRLALLILFGGVLAYLGINMLLRFL
jgi:hypothetical protein